MYTKYPCANNNAPVQLQFFYMHAEVRRHAWLQRQSDQRRKKVTYVADD